MLRLLALLPLHLLSCVAYVLIVYSGGVGWLEERVFSTVMASGSGLVLTGHDLMVMVAVFLLMLEGIKAVQTGWLSVANHTLSAVLFAVALGLLLTVAQFGTATWAVITLILLIDVLMGSVVSIMAARRDFSVG